MDWLVIILTAAGLLVFEIVSSIDNAIINAGALATMGETALRVPPDREPGPFRVAGARKGLSGRKDET